MKSKRISPNSTPASSSTPASTSAPVRSTAGGAVPAFSPQPASKRQPVPPTQEQIAALAHAIWIDRGRPEGRDLDNWLEAERQLRGEIRQPAAADDIPADGRALEPDAALRGRVEQALDDVLSPREPRSPTSL